MIMIRLERKKATIPILLIFPLVTSFIILFNNNAINTEINKEKFVLNTCKNT